MNYFFISTVLEKVLHLGRGGVGEGGLKGQGSAHYNIFGQSTSSSQLIFMQFINFKFPHMDKT